MRKQLLRILAVVTLGGSSLVATTAGADSGSPNPSSVTGVTSSSLGNFAPTFVGPAATGCSTPGCDLLTGPVTTPSTANLPPNPPGGGGGDTPEPDTAVLTPPRELPSPVLSRNGPDPAPPTVNCQPIGPGCDSISNNPGGANGVKGLDAVDSASQSTNSLGLDIEPADQSVCAGNGYVVEANNLGEILIFNEHLHRISSVIPLDTVMGLTGLNWSSGGDISCLYDASNGGHWFFTEIVSASSEANEGAFTGCFAGVSNACYEGIAVTKGSNPFGPYNVYFASADFDPAEPGSPNLLNDFAKIATSRDAFLLFWDEFPLAGPGLGGGGFNGAQEFAFNKNAMELGLPVSLNNGKPDPFFTVAWENMGLLPTPNGYCAVTLATCWYSVIPAEPPDPGQWDNSHSGSAFMLESLDFYGAGDNRMAVFDWTGLANLDSPFCLSCSGIRFGGQLFSNTEPYYYDAGVTVGAQKAGPTPLGDECGAAGLSLDPVAYPSCPEGPIETNGDNVTQASQAQGELWTSITTAVSQTFSSEASPETHVGAAYFVINTNGFDRGGTMSLVNQGYVSAAHEDMEMPSVAASDSGEAIMDFTLSGNGGPTGADHGGFYPSTAYGTFSGNGSGLDHSTIHIADLGQAPEDGFTEYSGYPGPTGPRWGDYSAAVFADGQFFFATNYIQSPACSDATFTLTVGTCGGTRDGYANWGTSVNSVSP
jgi:hypothetical protein